MFIDSLIVTVRVSLLGTTNQIYTNIVGPFTKKYNTSKLLKFIKNTEIVTRNSSPHGNKTARDQFKIPYSGFVFTIKVSTASELGVFLSSINNMILSYGITPTNYSINVAYINK